jgi:hypothetical protein
LAALRFALRTASVNVLSLIEYISYEAYFLQQEFLGRTYDLYRATNASNYIVGIPTRANSDNIKLVGHNINYSQRRSVAILVNKNYFI